ncbi:hypothetical protein HYQ46_006198 [Verticillium longisporum]|nr:hypothetical protein HYQ46_006198 [Verticillium longisporum]
MGTPRRPAITAIVVNNPEQHVVSSRWCFLSRGLVAVSRSGHRRSPIRSRRTVSLEPLAAAACDPRPPSWPVRCDASPWHKNTKRDVSVDSRLGGSGAQSPTLPLSSSPWPLRLDP